MLFGLVLAASGPLLNNARAELKPAAVFGDNMVLQRQMPVPVWGWSDPGATVTVRFAGQTKSTRAAADGKWIVKLDPLRASARPASLEIESGRILTLTNILVGEVWLASGQSNMEKPIGLHRGQKPCFHYQEELANGNYPQIRIFRVLHSLAATPRLDLAKFDDWRECSSNALLVTDFSAAAYFFAREIHTNLDVPVGIVESAWGGTRIAPWTARAGFETVPALAKYAATKLDSDKLRNTDPMAIYNSMIAPLAGLAMRGALWYQGESDLMGGTNNYDYLNYDDKMVALVDGWRAIWQAGDFPFYFVQIAPFKYYSGRVRRVPSRESLPEFWTLQSRAERRIKPGGMVVTTDIVNNVNDIHPRDKQDVGHRLALLARAKTYGENVVCTGPVFTRAKFEDGKVVLDFNHVDGGLKSRDGKSLSWFTIAGADEKFVSAEAKIVGDTVEVSSPEVKAPQGVRFAWDETAEPNLCNAAGLPAEPFRTDKLHK
jgi:sialate O-acetylesterase